MLRQPVVCDLNLLYIENKAMSNSSMTMTKGGVRNWDSPSLLVCDGKTRTNGEQTVRFTVEVGDVCCSNGIASC